MLDSGKQMYTFDYRSRAYLGAYIAGFGAISFSIFLPNYVKEKIPTHTILHTNLNIKETPF